VGERESGRESGREREWERERVGEREKERERKREVPVIVIVLRTKTKQKNSLMPTLKTFFLFFLSLTIFERNIQIFSNLNELKYFKKQTSSTSRPS
jgi:hypothetical protein